MLRTARLAVLVALLAASGAAVADVSLEITNPRPGVTTDAALFIRVVVEPAGEVTGVVARYAGLEIDLLERPTGDGWSRTVSLEAVEEGWYALEAEATTVDGATYAVSRDVLFNEPPVVTLHSIERIAAPTFHVHASCVDRSGVCDVQMKGSGAFPDVIASGELDMVVDLSGYDRERVSVQLSAVDALGGFDWGVGRSVYTEAGGRLSKLLEIDAYLHDYDGRRLFYSRSDASQASLHILDLETGITEDLGVVEPVRLARLGELGAFVVTGPPHRYSQLLHWQDGVWQELAAEPFGSVHIVGRYAAWRHENGRLLRFDERSHALAAPATSSSTNSGLTLHANGLVTFSSGYEAYAWQGGPVRRLTFDGGQTLYNRTISNVEPRSDGKNFIYCKLLGGWHQYSAIRLVAEPRDIKLTEFIHAPVCSSGSRKDSESNYLANEGWIAWFNKYESRGLWLMDPDRNASEIVPIPSGSPGLFVIEDLDRFGTVVYNE